MGEPPRTSQRNGITFFYYDDITVGFEDGSVSMVIAESTSSAQTEIGITVGMKWLDLQRILGDLVYVENAGLWSSPNLPGIYYEICKTESNGESASRDLLVDELYEITNPNRAFIRRIYILR
jgi:hypothetical protein